MGMDPESVVGSIGFNSAEYFIAIQGTWLAGCVPAGIYTTNSPEACHYVLYHSEAQICLCQGGKNAEKIASIRESLPKLKAIIVYWPKDGVPKVEEKPGLAKVMTWDQWMDVGKDVSDSVVRERVANVKPGNCATLIYTSGTTVGVVEESHRQGNPKAVMCSHDGCIYNIKNTPYYIHSDYPENRFVSYLPMNHIAAQFVDIMMPINSPITVYIAAPDALRGSLVTTMRKARPTFFVGVPRVWEKFAETLKSTFAQSSVSPLLASHLQYLKSWLISWFQSIGTAKCLSQQYGETPYIPYFYAFAKRKLFDPIKEKLGLDK